LLLICVGPPGRTGATGATGATGPAGRPGDDDGNGSPSGACHRFNSANVNVNNRSKSQGLICTILKGRREGKDGVEERVRRSWIGCKVIL